MVAVKPASILAVIAGGPVAFGLVSAGCAVLGFAAGSWSTNRRPGRRVGRVEFIDPREAEVDNHGAARRDFSAGMAPPAESAPTKAATAEAMDPECLLEFFYGDSPIVPGPQMMRRAAPLEPRDADGELPMFDVERADKLLALALDAYSHPPPGQGYQTQDLEGLPIVTFYDKEIMKAIYSGVLVVKLEGASNLRPASGRGNVSPYAEVYVNSGSFRTRAVKNTSNPTWNVRTALFIRNPAWDGLTIDVYDNNRANDKLGTAVLGLGELVGAKGRELRFRLPLRGPAGETASITLACVFLDFSKVDPDNITEIRPAPAKAKQLTSGSPGRPGKIAGMKPLAFVENKASDTQVWLYSDPEERKLVFSFRGTETSQWKDILTDANLMPCTFKPLKESVGKKPQEKGKIAVHSGFNSAYESVRRKLSSLLHAVTTSSPVSPEPWDVLVTGHSLGGALATLAAYELASYKEHAGNIQSVTLYTYGCPRVGNVTFAADFDQVLSDAWRVTNRRDLVPSVPPSGYMFKFKHVGNPVRLRENGIFYKGMENFVDDMEKDINMLMSLVSFKGTKEHSGEHYRKMLSEGKKILQQQQEIDKSSIMSTAVTAIHATSGSSSAAKAAPPVPAGAATATRAAQ